MSSLLIIPLPFSQYLAQADSDYRKKLSAIPLFDSNKTLLWSKPQKKLFAAIFYHLRGHFIDFMWYLANFAPDEMTKVIVMDNIKEELGEKKFSHETLYARFAKECGINISDEIINETHYLPFAKQFNKGHLAWLAGHDADEQFAAFAAYERLDNIDYPYLTEFAASLGISSQGLAFFRVHTHVEHFSSTLEKLVPLWERASEKVKNAVDFIYSHQLQMWQRLSDEIFHHS